MNAQAKDRALAERILWDIPTSQRNTFPHIGEVDAIANTLRRAQLTLHRWAEEECNGTIQRDGEQGDGRPYRPYESFYIRKDGSKAINRHKVPTPDREAGALRRVAEVCKAAGLHFYHQTDPRGCALYVSGQPMTHENYHRGIACL